MFWTEMYRIFSRKAAAVALAAVLFIALFYGRSAVWGEFSIDRGTVYYKAQAIEKDQEAAEEFTGILTEDTVRAIWEKYGSPVGVANGGTTQEILEVKSAGGRSENCCNRMAADVFAEKMAEDGLSFYVLREELSGSRYLQGDYYFGYTGRGWTGFWDAFLIAYALTCIMVVLLLAPTFSEDYACRTADIILPTANGRLRLWLTRTAAGCAAASFCYWLVCGSIFLLQFFTYGAEGLRVSCRLAGMPMYFLEDYLPIWTGIFLLYLCGWAAVLVLALLVQGVSAKCRNPFSALVKSLLVYAGPFAFMRVVLEAFFGGSIGRLLRYFCYSMPLSYPQCFLEAPGGVRVLMTGFLLTAAAAGAALGVSGYCRHQAGNII